MAWRSTLLLVVLVGGLWWLLQRGVAEDPVDPYEITEPVLDGRHLLDARRLSIRHGIDVRPIAIERREDGFEIVEPLRDLASFSRLEQIAAAFDSDLAPWPGEGAGLLAQTGLDAPRAEIRVTWDDHEVLVEIGDDGPLGSEVFVRKRGRVYIGTRALESALAGTVDDFREPAIFRHGIETVDRVSIARRRLDGVNDRITLARRGREFWLTEPIEARADLQVALSFLGGLLGLEARSFTPGVLGAQPEPDYVIEVRGARGLERVQLWRKGPNSVVGLQEQRQLGFVVEAPDIARGFEFPVDSLRSRVLNPLGATEIDEVRLDPGAGRGVPILLVRGDDGLLELREPIRHRADPDAAARVLEGIGALFADFVDNAGPPEQYGLGPGAFSVQVRGGVARTTVKILIGRTDGDRTYARRADEPFVVTVPTAAVERLRVAWPALVHRDVIEVLPASRVQELVYRQGDTVVTYRRGEGGVWRAEGGPLPPVDLDEVRDELADLRAARAVDPETVADPGTPILVELRDANGTSLGTLELFGREGGALVRRPGVDVLFQLRPALSATLLAPAPR